MKTRKILITGKQGVGKTRLAELLSATYNLPVTESVESMAVLPDEDGIYTSNSIGLKSARDAKLYGFTLIYIE